MDYFSNHSEGVYTLPNPVYHEIQNDTATFFKMKTRKHFPGQVVYVQPEISADFNRLASASGSGRVECEPLLITKVEAVDDFSIYGFVRLRKMPEVFHNLVNSLYEQNENMRQALTLMGANAEAVALGVNNETH